MTLRAHRPESVVLLTLLALAGCGGSGPPVPAQGGAPVPDSTTRTNLYVSNQFNSTITVYEPGTKTPLRTIKAGLANPQSMTFDDSNNLYVANYRTSTITVYANGGTGLTRFFSTNVDKPNVVAYDGSNNHIYVSNWEPTGSGSITIYSKQGKYLGKITDMVACPDGLAIDSSGNLYVVGQCPPSKTSSSGSYNYYVTVYSGTTNKLIRTITDGIGGAGHIALDSKDNLYVGNAEFSDITVYKAGTTKLLRTIQDGSYYDPGPMAFDQSNDLFVMNTEAVNEYAAGSGKLLQSITQGLTGCNTLIVGPYLNVASDYGGRTTSSGGTSYLSFVTTYNLVSGKLTRTISDGVAGPNALAYGP